MGNDELEWKQVSCGTASTCAILANGSAHCWGANDEGQSSVPEGIDSWRQIDTGYAHTCGVATNGSAYCWYTTPSPSFQRANICMRAYRVVW